MSFAKRHLRYSTCFNAGFSGSPNGWASHATIGGSNRVHKAGDIKVIVLIDSGGMLYGVHSGLDRIARTRASLCAVRHSSRQNTDSVVLNRLAGCGKRVPEGRKYPKFA